MKTTATQNASHSTRQKIPSPTTPATIRFQAGKGLGVVELRVRPSGGSTSGSISMVIVMFFSLMVSMGKESVQGINRPPLAFESPKIAHSRT